MPPTSPARPVQPAPSARPNDLARLARLLDAAVRVPGTNFRVGLDAIIGLVPGIGDLAGTALSGYIVLAGVRAGAPAAVLVRMLLNVAIDTVVGAVPLVGDLFDAGWKANSRNVALLERHVAAPADTRRASRAVVVGVIAGLTALLVAGLVLGGLAIRAVLRHVG
jgi:hypothetical protein